MRYPSYGMNTFEVPFVATVACNAYLDRQEELRLLTSMDFHLSIHK